MQSAEARGKGKVCKGLLMGGARVRDIILAWGSLSWEAGAGDMGRTTKGRKDEGYDTY
jgi:hypothetical protein